MNKPLLMQSLPNSGSTWFAALLAKHIPGCRYYDKEFFNPVCNLKHEMVLRRNFGCELIECYRNIALPGDSYIDADISSTWGTENYTFTKECNSAFKLPAFVRYFDCFVFLRSAENTFPPGRVRVWSFYEHAWFALREAGCELHGVNIRQRALEAHAVLTDIIECDALQLGLPIIYWEQVMADPAAVVARLGTLTDLASGLLTADLAATSRNRDRAA